MARSPSAADPRSLLLSSLHGYRSEWLGADGVAALTLLAIAVPEQLATSRLAGMPPITGLYAFVAGTAMFAVLGSNPRMSVGADSTIAPLFAVGVARLAATGSPSYVALVGILAVLVGAMVMLIGALRLGWIAEFLSTPIISGFLAGVAVIIVVHELPDLLGLAVSGGSTADRIGAIARNLGTVRRWDLGIGLGVVALVVAIERLNRRVPGALVGMVVSAVVVGALDLHAKEGVAVLGTIAHGAPRLGLSHLSWTSLGDVAPLAVAVALVVVSQSAATTRAFPADDQTVNVSRDFVGVGAGSIAAGLAGAFPVNASPPRTGAIVSAGGRTQLAGLAAAAVVVVLVPAAGVLRDVPITTLAAVLLLVAARIFPTRQLRDIARFDAVEMGLATITLLSVALVGVEEGIGVAAGLAILDRTRRSSRPQLHVLGRIAGTTSWAPLSSTEHPEQVPGVLVVLFATPLWYGNADQFRAQLERSFARAVDRPQVVVLDAVGMTDVDYTGAIALGHALDQLDRRGIRFAVSRAGRRARQGLERAGLLQRIGEGHFFDSVDEAVLAMTESAAGTAGGGGAARA